MLMVQIHLLQIKNPWCHFYHVFQVLKIQNFVMVMIYHQLEIWVLPQLQKPSYYSNINQLCLIKMYLYVNIMRVLMMILIYVSLQFFELMPYPLNMGQVFSKNQIMINFHQMIIIQVLLLKVVYLNQNFMLYFYNFSHFPPTVQVFY